jgi:23S rRNA (guanine745-N1)-methyltransferase
VEASILKCPVCGGALDAGAAAAVCERAHSFDVARSGYLNLLLSHQRHSPEPGDCAAMLRSRRAILHAGFYEPIAAATHRAALDALSDRASAHVADFGCGEGYYLAGLKRALAGSQGEGRRYYGVDISRAGIKMATSYDRAITWIVASLHDSPFAARSLDVVLSMFAPIDAADVTRVLRPDGAFITVTPGPDHLDALRAIIYESVVPHPETPGVMAEDDRFELVSASRVQASIAARSNAEIMNLLAMTPYYWNISLETRARVERCSHLDLSLDAYVRVYLPV